MIKVLKKISLSYYLFLPKTALFQLFIPVMLAYSIRITLGTLDKSFRYQNPILFLIVIFLTGILSFGLFFIRIVIGIISNFFQLLFSYLLILKPLGNSFILSSFSP
jgi:hypothetical protein